MKWLLISVAVFGLNAFAKTIEGVEFKEEMMVGAQKLVLNGAGLRTKRKFGMNFRVYVGALYVPVKSQDATSLINSAETKVIEMVFLRALDKKTLQDAWTEGLEKNCTSDCAQAKEQLKVFNDLMVDVKDKSRMTLTFEKDSVSVNLNGKTSSTGQVKGEPFRKAMLAVFIGQHPPTEDLKTGLLGK